MAAQSDLHRVGAFEELHMEMFTGWKKAEKPADVRRLSRAIRTCLRGCCWRWNLRGKLDKEGGKGFTAPLQKKTGEATVLRTRGGWDRSLKMGNQSRHKVAYILPTWSRCLDRFYSLSLFTGSLQDLQEPCLHGVLHNNTSTGRSCWHWRNSLFSAEIPPMRLARDMPRDWQISQRVSSSSIHN
jgi:hypothetical protein